MSYRDDASMVPSELSLAKLRACMSCSLVKSTHQFFVNGCENCPFLNMQNDREQVSACTTASFSGIYSLMNPKDSWVAKWQRVGRFQPGCYAVSIDGQLPDYVVEEAAQNGGKPWRTRATQMASRQ
mmetsp:Transcript_20031/g.49163  ORF Transcript_20031/g.49163 Transcript_20031/m.49163 type:complete len:126 (-) Transcript_20031:52-429(-)